jgi:hypothetical protein
MSEKQYQVLLDLFHEYNEAFLSLSQEIRTKFYARLYQK